MIKLSERYFILEDEEWYGIKEIKREKKICVERQRQIKDSEELIDDYRQ